MKLVAKRKLTSAKHGDNPLRFYADKEERRTSSLVEDTTGHIADTTVHGATGAVVGTTNTQTLTNKTLTSPALNTPTLTNPNVASATTFTGLGTGANGFILKNLKNAAASALSGTQLDIEIDIGGVAYHFTVYPTKA